MTKAIQIQNLQFEFDNQWVIYKFDDQPDLQKIKSIEGTKDADIIAVSGNKALYLIEVTDLRGASVENKKKVANFGPGGMIQEFAQKTRDTIPAIVGAFRTGKYPEHWKPVMEKIADRDTAIYAVLWMEQDAPCTQYEEKVHFTNMRMLGDKVRHQMKWLTSHVFVTSLDQERNKQKLPGLTVKNLPGAGQPSK